MVKSKCFIRLTREQGDCLEQDFKHLAIDEIPDLVIINPNNFHAIFEDVQ
ncbi:hypothetical protein [Bizionia arctica]|uniref:Uncharacterized protein n=1 Tax=Bizionia arctica TaxID=1495645 RepID=A0A917LM02_9FLAO|nr:hypothetical protein [Bizionia arctica]GGG43372.1 hypothetical protein GCM10010976_13580 [Bizionia arctica]